MKPQEIKDKIRWLQDETLTTLEDRVGWNEEDGNLCDNDKGIAWLHAQFDGIYDMIDELLT